MRHCISGSLTVVALLILGACGNTDQRSESVAKPKPHAVRPIDTRCRAIQTRAAARRLALKVDYLLIAPEHESRRQILGTLAGSLYATCRQPTLPGVSDPLEYRPVRSVIAQMQTEYDEEEISGH